MAYKDPNDPRKRAASRRYYERNKPRYLTYSRRSQEKYRSIVRALKDRPCADCRKRYPYYVMDFDHRDGTSKAHEMAKIHFQKSVRLIKEEAAKCDVVCSNCHRERTHQRKLAKAQATPGTCLKHSDEAGTSSLTRGSAKSVPRADQPGT